MKKKRKIMNPNIRFNGSDWKKYSRSRVYVFDGKYCAKDRQLSTMTMTVSKKTALPEYTSSP